MFIRNVFLCYRNSNAEAETMKESELVIRTVTSCGAIKQSQRHARAVSGLKKVANFVSRLNVSDLRRTSMIVCIDGMGFVRQ